MSLLLRVLCMGMLAAIVRTQELPDCGNDTNTFTVGSTEDAATLAASLECANGDFTVRWIGEVSVEETLHVQSGTSLNVTGDGPGAIADGLNRTQLFRVDGSSRLYLSGMTLTHGNSSSWVDPLFAIRGYPDSYSSLFVDGYTVSYFSLDGSVSGVGGAIFANESSVSFGGSMSFVANSASFYGGAICAIQSTISWHGARNKFIANHVGSSETLGEGGAIYATRSNVSWDGDGTEFSSNDAGWGGGAICADRSNISWDSDGTEFSSNSASFGGGGAMFAADSTVSWQGNNAVFRNNSVSEGFYAGGGAIAAVSSIVSWKGDGTMFSSNSAAFGGAIWAAESSDVSWAGQNTMYTLNNASEDGGAICIGVENSEYDLMEQSYVSWNGITDFSSNTAGRNGGGVAIFETYSWSAQDVFSGATFTENRAGNAGGAMYLFASAYWSPFKNISFQSNSAVVGGAVAAYVNGYRELPTTFSGCAFSRNTATGVGGTGIGGAVDSLLGALVLSSCDFEANSADIGGAVRLGGTDIIRDSSFRSNFASRGLAVAVVGSATISGSSFDGNELYCAVGSYSKQQEGGDTGRFGVVCLDCPNWEECSGCTIANGKQLLTCEAPLEHTTADEPGSTLKTLNIDGGFWRATAESDTILPCFNADACAGGKTGATSFCATGYKGSYCAVCETNFARSFANTCTRCSSSRRAGLMAATAIAALVSVSASLVIGRYMMSTVVEGSDAGHPHQRMLQVVPVQSLKIVIVVWQILTQFADAANSSYPGVYGDFLSAIDIINFDLGSVLAAGCLWSEITFHERLLVSTLWPLVVVGGLAMTYGIAMRRNVAVGDAAVREMVGHKHQAALLLLTFLVYSSVSSVVLQTFACEELDDQVQYLRADYSIHCTDARHRVFQVYAGFMVVLYPVGIPLLYGVLLFRSRDVLSDAGADKTAGLSIASLWEPYTPERFYYEVVECGRRFMLTGVVVFIFPNDAAQIAITMLIALFFLLVFESLSPYKSESDTWLARGGNVIVFLSMFDALMRKVDVSAERGQSQAAFAGVLVAGHVLMILALVVEVIGVCFASRKERRVVGEVHSFSGSESCPGSREEPVFENAPAASSWISIARQVPVVEEPLPTRSSFGALSRP